ncbi:MAG TPA: hypothetical protein VFC59_00900, partial [Cryobacterium sp.]|nr:hypothetical protein [Cryobacterium sp.]
PTSPRPGRTRRSVTDACGHGCGLSPPRNPESDAAASVVGVPPALGSRSPPRLPARATVDESQPGAHAALSGGCVPPRLLIIAAP